MFNFINKNKIIIFTFIFTLFLGILTFLTFIDRSFILLNDENLEKLLLVDLIVVLIFFIFIILKIRKLIRDKTQKKISSKTNLRYIAFFSVAALLPSILIAFFSLSLFSFALEKYLDKKVSTVVNNSYDMAKSYVDEIRNNIEADILLIGIDLNRNVNIFYDNNNKFKNILSSQRLLRRLDEIHIIDGSGNVIISSTTDLSSKYLPPSDVSLQMVSVDERPLKIINAFTNKSAALLKLNNYIDTYLYVIKFLDPEISKYLTNSEQALNFYYTVQNNKTGIKISFALIYLIVVTLLLFFSITIAIRFASRFFNPIANLIGASYEISSGNLDAKVPIIDTDEEIHKLNLNFNSMIEKLKNQQEKLLLSERHEAWENVSRTLAHEIKNPLTPIQLSIDRLKDKYANKLKDKNGEFESYLKTINRQIKTIENLVNEFSDFARMPKPVFKKTNIRDVVYSNLKLIELSNKKIICNLISNEKFFFLNCDEEQFGRVFLNLFKNSLDSLNEKSSNKPSFIGKITVVITSKNNYIYLEIEDNGDGFSKEIIKNIVKPYFTTKQKGTGLGLAIVNKIINDHDGTINFLNTDIGAKVTIKLPTNVH
jgi:two-component system nitrogen regulation sensor histidine kinase NtrY